MRTLKKERDKAVIGRIEKIDFPELGIEEIDCKIDTGAYTSSIHCHDIEPFTQDGREMVRFRLLDPTHPAFNHKEIVMPVKTRRKVKSSFGNTQKRIIIQTKMLIFGKLYVTELSLADRSKMTFPVLMGRKAISKRFLVDVSKTNLSHKSKLSSNP
ncbi:MAG: RimK/LysX family protein [Candidatus Cyclonatronum sp.]|uniref:ATP-dependent zinc protease family protein n=1 Tax=Cyclonatronum sp. TaxID=3024185 RepID=UPI0025BDEF48|nr:RimK/LysX family protein [Cyclonatronum sp.]MCC5933105.1 ATP-dependent zinc protease [Balneolales bacterium]MCH8486664.1 RimK/LysX family protein [Cyclonatronum sp.]